MQFPTENVNNANKEHQAAFTNSMIFPKPQIF